MRVESESMKHKNNFGRQLENKKELRKMEKEYWIKKNDVKNAGLYIIEFPPKGFGSGEENQRGKKEKKKKIWGKYNFWQYQIVNNKKKVCKTQFNTI